MTERIGSDLPVHVDLLLGKPPKLRDALARCCELKKS